MYVCALRSNALSNLRLHPFWFRWSERCARARATISVIFAHCSFLLYSFFFGYIQFSCALPLSFFNIFRCRDTLALSGWVNSTLLFFDPIQFFLSLLHLCDVRLSFSIYLNLYTELFSSPSLPQRHRCWCRRQLFKFLFRLNVSFFVSFLFWIIFAVDDAHGAFHQAESLSNCDSIKRNSLRAFFRVPNIRDGIVACVCVRVVASNWWHILQFLSYACMFIKMGYRLMCGARWQNAHCCRCLLSKMRILIGKFIGDAVFLRCRFCLFRF